MEYRKFGDTYLVRIDKGEEIIEQILRFAEEEKIALADVSALGATDDFTVGVFNLNEKKYYPHTYKGNHEIVSLVGTLTMKDGAHYQHLHLSAGNAEGNVVGGHLTKAVVSATCEMTVRVLPGAVDRTFDEELGINLIRFTD